MATEGKQLSISITAGEDLSTHQYKVVSVADGQRAANNEEATGVLINKPQNGEDAILVHTGEAKVYAGGAITKGARIQVTTGGLVTSISSGNAVGQSLQTVTGSGSIMRAMVAFPGVDAA